MTDITTGIGNLMTLVEGIFTSIVGNTYLLVVFAAGFVGLAVRALRKITKGAKAVG